MAECCGGGIGWWPYRVPRISSMDSLNGLQNWAVGSRVKYSGNDIESLTLKKFSLCPFNICYIARRGTPFKRGFGEVTITEIKR